MKKVKLGCRGFVGFQMNQLLRMRLKLGVCWGLGLLTFEMPVLKWSHLDFLEMWLLLASELDLGIYCLWDKKPSTSHSLESFFALSFAPSKFSTLDEHSCYRPVLIALLTCAPPQGIQYRGIWVWIKAAPVCGCWNVNLYYSSSQLEPWWLITELTALVDLVYWFLTSPLKYMDHFCELMSSTELQQGYRPT